MMPRAHEIPEELMLRPLLENNGLNAEEYVKLMRCWFMGVYDLQGTLIAPGVFRRLTRLEEAHKDEMHWIRAGSVLAALVFLHGYFGLSWDSIVEFFKALGAAGAATL